MYMTGKVGVTFRGCAFFFLRNLLYLIRNLLYFIYLSRGILRLAEDFRIKRDMTLTALWSASCLSLSMAEYLVR